MKKSLKILSGRFNFLKFFAKYCWDFCLIRKSISLEDNTSFLQIFFRFPGDGRTFLCLSHPKSSDMDSGGDQDTGHGHANPLGNFLEGYAVSGPVKFLAISF